MNIDRKYITLALNASWEALGKLSIRRAITQFFSSSTVLAVKQLEDNTFQTYKWEEWIDIKPKKADIVIHSIKREIIVPTVLLITDIYIKPLIRPKHQPSKLDIFNRDENIDQYTGKILTRRERTIDHIIPLSKGGSNDWTNLVTTHKDINVFKGDKLAHEVGLKLIRKPFKPKPMVFLPRNIGHPDWKPFLYHLK